MYVRFPFISDRLNKLLMKELESLTKNYAPHLRINLAFFNSHKIRSYFKHKESLPDALRSMVVYRFTCAKCSLAYIGSTKKIFSLRIDEHRGFNS